MSLARDRWGRSKAPTYDPDIGFDGYRRRRIDRYACDAPPIDDQQFQEVCTFAAGRNALLLVPNQRRNELMKALVEATGSRRPLIACHPFQRNYYPWAVRMRPHASWELRWRTFNRYLLAGPRTPMRLEYDDLAFFGEGCSDFDLAVMDGGETWLANSYWLRDALRLQNPHRVLFSGNPFRSPGSLHYQMRWLDWGLLGRYHEWRRHYVWQEEACDHIGVGYRHARELLERVNEVCFPPVTEEQLEGWVREWIGRRTREGFPRMTDDQFELLREVRIEW